MREALLLDKGPLDANVFQHTKLHSTPEVAYTLMYYESSKV